MSQLSEFYIKKAKSELREDESRKQQSYEILKTWAIKHSFIKILDSSCLNLDIALPYLRSKKYHMERVYDSIERMLIFIKLHKSWSYFHGENLKRALELYDTGYLLVSKERDSNGCRTVICTHKMDATKFTSDDAFRLFCLISSTLFSEEETQVSGVVYISDARAVTLSYMALFPMKDFYDFSVQGKSLPIRLKKLLMVGVPKIASQFLNIARAAISEKLNKRLLSLGDISQLSSKTDVSILPQEYGGRFTVEEILNDFKGKIIEHAAYASDMFNKFDINFSKIEDKKDFFEPEMCGTFRKLEID